MYGYEDKPGQTQAGAALLLMQFQRDKFPATDQSLVSMALLVHSLARLWAISPCNFLHYACCHSENNVCKLSVQGRCSGRRRILAGKRIPAAWIGLPCWSSGPWPGVGYCLLFSTSVYSHRTTKLSILAVNLQNSTYFWNNGFQYFWQEQTKINLSANSYFRE